VLQDIGLAVHPPMLYLGYVGFSISFSFAVAALLEGRIDAAWARWVRPWTLVAWIFLTLGIAMGPIGPITNSAGAAGGSGSGRECLADAVACRHRAAAFGAGDGEAQRAEVWTVLLSILTSRCRLLGTFLVRSGVLTSVHAFATDPTRGRLHPVDLCIFIGGSLTLYAWRASALKQGGLSRRSPREGALVLNNLFPHHGMRDRIHRHALSAGTRGPHRREDFGWRAVLQFHLCAACSCR